MGIGLSDLAEIHIVTALEPSSSQVVLRVVARSWGLLHVWLLSGLLVDRSNWDVAQVCSAASIKTSLADLRHLCDDCI